MSGEGKLRILIVGGSGVIGKAIAEELRQRHEVLIAGRNGPDAKIDIENVDR